MRAWVLSGVCAGAVLVPGTAVAAPVPEADLAFHGTAVLNGDRVEVRLTPRNNGPAAVADATVRLRWSVELADEQELPARCAREDARTVVCGTGALVVDAAGEQVRVPVRLRERPSEVTLEIDTAWSAGAVDQDRSNDRMAVLVLDTGDEYAF
ncbi:MULTISPECIES: hypothetical protein [unclassified Streptomyces]|uniref:hypothetical protein n=1 Tax=unclassified Streptomyces TaxID=2593676 RepID=UPI0004BE9FA2|nr:MULTISPECIES: hypothetical protein [unclassified Streptomyces]KOX01364.1 hypothetical protein ADL04_13605 [Streptomyces sp. NRRL B-3648]